MKRLIGISVLLLPAAAVRLAAADAPAKPQAAAALARQLWPPEQMMSAAADGIARRYKLDARQEAFTRDLLTRRVTEFLDRHDQQVWPLFAELAKQQMSGGKPDAATARRIAEQGIPIFEDAKREILRAQDEFRGILNDEQKRMHDLDLKNLHFQLNSVEQRLTQWHNGQGAENPLGQVRLPNNAAMWPSPIQPLQSPPTPPKVESEWERYVKDFIQRYRLDPPQQQQARSILNDLQAQADQYRKTRREDLTEAERRVAQARAAGPEALARALAIQRLLNKPFDDWFEELKTRLQRIPTEQQKSANITAAPSASAAAPEPAAAPVSPSSPLIPPSPTP